jgi:hypothetical protein
MKVIWSSGANSLPKGNDWGTDSRIRDFTLGNQVFGS